MHEVIALSLAHVSVQKCWVLSSSSSPSCNQLSTHYHPCYTVSNKIPVTFSMSLQGPHSCGRNSITYFGSFINGMAAQLGQVSLKAPLNDLRCTTDNSEITEG